MYRDDAQSQCGTGICHFEKSPCHRIRCSQEPYSGRLCYERVYRCSSTEFCFASEGSAGPTRCPQAYITVPLENLGITENSLANSCLERRRGSTNFFRRDFGSFSSRILRPLTRSCIAEAALDSKRSVAASWATEEWPLPKDPA